jgi:hypothetical protein
MICPTHYTLRERKRETVHFSSHSCVIAVKLTDSVDVTGLAYTDKFLETIHDARLVASCVLNGATVHTKRFSHHSLSAVTNSVGATAGIRI